MNGQGLVDGFEPNGNDSLLSTGVYVFCGTKARKTAAFKATFDGTTQKEPLEGIAVMGGGCL